MNDPHVEALNYRFVSESQTDTFTQAEPLSLTLGDFDVELKSERFTAKPKSHYPDEAAARKALEPFLRAWEENSLLEGYRIRFRFVDADVIERKPLPRTIVASTKPAVVGGFVLSAAATRQCRTYPSPDYRFVSSDLTERLTNRLKRFKDQGEPLCGMAYWVLNLLETTFGNRKGVATTLRVEEEVFHVFGDLTAIDDPVHGRKVNPKKFRSTLLKSRKRSLQDPLAPKEVQWIEAVVILLIRRVGQHNANAYGLTQLTMGDLPQL